MYNQESQSEKKPGGIIWQMQGKKGSIVKLYGMFSGIFE